MHQSRGHCLTQHQSVGIFSDAKEMVTTVVMSEAFTAPSDQN